MCTVFVDSSFEQHDLVYVSRLSCPCVNKTNEKENIINDSDNENENENAKCMCVCECILMFMIQIVFVISMFIYHEIQQQTHTRTLNNFDVAVTIRAVMVYFIFFGAFDHFENLKC